MLKSKLFIALVIFISISFCETQAQDSCDFKDFRYPDYSDWKNLKIISDSIYFNNYIVFKVKLNSINKDIDVELFFVDRLENLLTTTKVYSYVVFSRALFSNAWDHNEVDSLSYLKIVSLGQEKSPGNFPLFFDRLDMLGNNASIFKNIKPYSISKKSKDIYYIFKTNLSGILIESDLQKNNNDDLYNKNLKVLIPFIRFIPLYDVPISEIISARLFERKPLQLCKKKK